MHGSPKIQAAGRALSIGGYFARHFLVPLGVHWWTAQIGPLLLSLFQRLRRAIRS